MKPIYTAIVLALLCMACDPFANPENARLTFSSDTLFFDTIFTAIGSTTMEVRAKNLTDRPVLIDEIRLAGGEDSPFRININGYPSTISNNITIAAGDSIFIFVDVEIDPFNSDNPVSVIDSIMFTSGNYFSRVILAAWGQDIFLIENGTIGNETWHSGKPYIVYGTVLIDTSATLNVTEGTRVFFHNDASMIVAGNIIVTGTKEHQVTFASDRTSKEYEDVPGQWKGIVFRSCSSSNIITDAVIRNATIALDIEGDPLVGRPDIDILNTSVIHNSVSSLNAVYSDVKSANSLFANTGFSTVSLTNATDASFIHCTIANYWVYNIRTKPSLFLGKGSAENATLPSLSAYNSVVAGDLKSEITIDALSSELPGLILFDSCFVVTYINNNSWWNEDCFIGTTIGSKPGFIDRSLFDFRPDTLSPLSDVAGKTKALLYPEDIRHRQRPAFNSPDIGAYERQPGEKSE